MHPPTAAFLHDPVALVSIPAAGLPAPPARGAALSGARHPLALCGFGATALLAMGFLAAGLPMISVCMLAISGVSSFVVGSALGLASTAQEQPPWVIPDDIASSEVRATYRSILLGIREVEDALHDAPRLRSSLASALERCRASVELAGRTALVANPLQRYLERHDASHVRSALDRLRARAMSADQGAAGAWNQAVIARERQLVTIDQIRAKRDEICARLELIHAALDGFAAAIVRLQALDDEQVVLAGESVIDQLAEITDDLEVLETALAA
ncbi:MAG TPA: hypothetical protein VFT22_35175 [Kofleriaceae bacterium]|nr:hypothetical protein [Kofleriaceae bacterium]